MSIQIYLDGNWVPKEKAVLSVYDHGVLYGDGVFEGIRSYGCRVFKLNEHIDRLWESAHTLMLKIPLTKEQMAEVIIETLRKNSLTDGYIRVVVTRGVGDLGLDPRKCKQPSIFVIADKIKLYPDALYQDGLEIISVATRRNLPESVNPQIKSLNYLNNIFAKIEAVNSGYEEALMLGANGTVAECTGENVFLVKGKALITPPSYVGILKGITREAVMGLAEKSGLKVLEQCVTRHEVYNADEVFLTGTAAEIVPIVKVDKRTIGTGKPGKITAKLLTAFRTLTTIEGTAYAL